VTRNPRGYADYYAGIRDEEIERLSLDVQSLVPEAREALRREMERRQIVDASMGGQAQAPREEVPDPRAQAEIFARKLTIFFLGEVVALAIILYLVPARDTLGVEKVLEFILRAGILMTILLSWVVSKSSVPKRTKILSVLGVWVPIALVMLFVAFA